MTGRVRIPVAIRREQIIAVTTELLDTIGVANIRVADVAKAMQTSTALIFYHFKSKDALVAEAFEHHFARDLGELDKVLAWHGPMRKLRGLAGLFYGPGARAGWQVWIDACAVAQREPDMQARVRAIDQRYATAICGVLEEGVAAGLFSCPDPTASARRLMALNDGLSTAVALMQHVTADELTAWMAAQLATEAGIDVAMLRDGPNGPAGRPPPMPHGPDFTD